MDECDTGALAADTWLLVDQPCTLCLQMIESQFDVGDCRARCDAYPRLWIR